jgi:hypothetical protein
MDEILSLMHRETTCAYAALHVKALNSAAVAFYERHGFECDPIHGVLRRHYWIHNECAHARPRPLPVPSAAPSRYRAPPRARRLSRVAQHRRSGFRMTRAAQVVGRVPVHAAAAEAAVLLLRP